MHQNLAASMLMHLPATISFDVAPTMGIELQRSRKQNPVYIVLFMASVTLVCKHGLLIVHGLFLQTVRV